MSASETVTREPVEGWDCIGLANPHVALKIFPELGGRVASLYDRHSGRDWLWSPPGRTQLFGNRRGDHFEASPHLGLDECIPTIAPCTWQGRDLPDHGEIWNQPWMLDVEALNQGIVALVVNLPITPLRLERRISLRGPCIRFDYRVVNLSAQPEKFLWAMHPLFTLHAGDTLQLPADVAAIKLECAGGQAVSGCGEIWSWPEPFAGVRMDRLELPDMVAGYLKAFAKLREGEVRFRNPAKQASLTIRWDTAINPYLGIWLTRGGYHGWHHVALEPTNCSCDSLAVAVNDLQPSGRLAPNETRVWWVEWLVGT